MMSTFDAEIVLDPTNISNLVLDNYYKEQIDLKSVINKGKQYNFRNSYNTSNRSTFFYQSQDDNQQFVFISGSTIDFTLARQQDQIIDQIKYYFTLTNQNTTASGISLYQIPCAYIEYVAVYINNKEIQKLDTYQLNLINLMTIRETAVQLKLIQLNYNQTTLGQNERIFLQDSLIHFENIGDIKIRIKFYPDQTQNISNLQLSQSQLIVETFQLTTGFNDYVLRNQKQINYRYLDIDNKQYWFSSVNANQTYKLKLSSKCLCAFMLVQAQLTRSTNQINTRLANASQLPIKNVQIIRIGQNLQVTEVVDQITNYAQSTKHFKNYWRFEDPTTPIYNDSFLLNFTLNPQMAFDGSLCRAQQITLNNYEVAITFSNSYNAPVSIFVYTFYYQVCIHNKKKITLQIQP